MFDMYACWTDGVPNTTVKVPCPWYLPWYDQVRNGVVSRECGPDGQWLTVNHSRTWRDHSQCNVDDNREKQENQMMILAYFRVMYTVGYSLSLASLSLAVVILLIFRKLRCTRNYIHTNLFASFILRAVSILTRDALLMKDAPEFRDNKDVSIVLSDQVMSGCRVAQVLMQYCVGANYYWLLVEGLYLHNLLVLMVFSENSYFCVYLFIGWGTPVLFVVPWIVVRYLYENTRLAKSTLTLIPLLGIHEVVFAVMTEEQTEGVLRNVNLFFELFFNSFQGFLVAILYCFVNKEVQSEIKKKWQRWKLGITILEDLRNTGSNTQQGGTAPRFHHDQACSPDCPLNSGSQLCSDPTLTVQHHYHPGAKKGKAYCYISARKQVLNGLDVPALPQCAGEGAVMFSESYC
ncbi:gastric inhibitory polypeptide receptor [Labeo rohita]|uniref:Gastric inhibitory polypeptide receptor n=1 Tax=Labeo rohita TaxID=84645 RepID=A0A498LIL6_LABRO|nr:gastric inhibitory polypeptide receptor [Labeo rohita]